ncbi:MAG: CBM50 / GH23 [uncultured Frankineae bacterium]|uniref:CBM50 / GH23 n=1 Tax=uncultured Frankineae bacterium TaxID=437475 RepID=A0A6J4LNU3_9ACTN|nr:MAG: CBM50 / GH23 [uncultured Frankineae bacterium]
MTRSTSSRARRRTGRTTVGVLLALAVVSTAGAPSVLTVRPGDTLWDLARAHGTSVSALQALNDLPGNGTIYAGQTLRISGGQGGGGQSSAGAGAHRVVRGETLSGIALRHGVSQSAIASANGLSGGRIYAGTTLRIPGGRGGSASTAGVPTTNAGVRIPERVRSSVAENRRVLAARSHPSKAQVRRMVADTARRHGVSPSLAVAVAYHESGFQQRVVSGVNAIGVMQVLPSTGRVLSRQHGRSLDLLDTQDNITAGVLLLRQLIRSEGTAERALAGYYQGLGSIARKGLLPQTHAYLRNIAVLRTRFANG